MNAQEIQELAESIEIRPCFWKGCKKIRARVVEIRHVQSVKGPAILLYLNLRWDGLFGGSLKRQSFPIIIEEGTSLKHRTYQLNVKGANLRDPNINLWPCRDGMVCYRNIPVRAIQEDTGVEGIEVWHEANGRISVNPEGCLNGTRVEHEQTANGTVTINICLRDQHGDNQHYHFTPEAAEALGKALCFAAKQ